MLKDMVVQQFKKLKALYTDLKIENDFHDFDIEDIQENKVFLKDGKVSMYYLISSPNIHHFDEKMQEALINKLLDKFLSIDDFGFINKSMKELVDTEIQHFQSLLKTCEEDKARAKLLKLRIEELEAIDHDETARKKQTISKIVVKKKNVQEAEKEIVRYFKEYVLVLPSKNIVMQLLYNMLHFEEIEADISDWQPSTLYDLNIKEEETYLTTESGKYVSFLAVRDFRKKYTKHGFLTEAINNENVYFSKINIKNVDEVRADDFLSTSLDNLEEKRDEVRLKSTKRKLKSDIDAMGKIVTDTYEGNEKMVLMEMFFCITAESKKELFDKKKKLIKNLKKYAIALTSSTWEQKAFFMRVLTLQVTDFAVATVLKTVAGSYPIASISLRQKNGGYVGQTEEHQAVLMNLVKDEIFRSWNMIVFGRARAGKSSSVKVLIELAYSLGFEILIIDPQDEYIELAKYLDGNVISSSYFKLNVHDLMLNVSDAEQRISLLDKNINRILLFYKSYNSSLTGSEMAIIKRVELATYERFGITRNTTYDESKNMKMPIISDVKETFEMYKKERTNISEVEANALFKLEQMFEALITGQEHELFNQHTSNVVNISAFTVFTVKDLMTDALLYSPYMFNVENFIQQRVYMNKMLGKKTIEVVDEGHKFLDEANPDVAKRLAVAAKEYPKFDGGLWFITQQASDVFNVSKEISKHALAIMSNATYLFLMNMSDDDLTLLNKSSGGRLLTETDIKYVRNAEVRQTLLLVNNTIPYRFTFKPNPKSFKYYGGA